MRIGWRTNEGRMHAEGGYIILCCNSVLRNSYWDLEYARAQGPACVLDWCGVE
jgi:hypothetical protein